MSSTSTSSRRPPPLPPSLPSVTPFTRALLTPPPPILFSSSFSPFASSMTTGAAKPLVVWNETLEAQWLKVIREKVGSEASLVALEGLSLILLNDLVPRRPSFSPRRSSRGQEREIEEEEEVEVEVDDGEKEERKSAFSSGEKREERDIERVDQAEMRHLHNVVSHPPKLLIRLMNEVRVGWQNMKQSISECVQKGKPLTGPSFSAPILPSPSQSRFSFAPTHQRMSLRSLGPNFLPLSLLHRLIPFNVNRSILIKEGLLLELTKIAAMCATQYSLTLEGLREVDANQIDVEFLEDGPVEEEEENWMDDTNTRVHIRKRQLRRVAVYLESVLLLCVAMTHCIADPNKSGDVRRRNRFQYLRNPPDSLSEQHPSTNFRHSSPPSAPFTHSLSQSEGKFDTHSCASSSLETVLIAPPLPLKPPISVRQHPVLNIPASSTAVEETGFLEILCSLISSLSQLQPHKLTHCQGILLNSAIQMLSTLASNNIRMQNLLQSNNLFDSLIRVLDWWLEVSHEDNTVDLSLLASRNRQFQEQLVDSLLGTSFAPPVYHVPFSTGISSPSTVTTVPNSTQLSPANSEMPSPRNISPSSRAFSSSGLRILKSLFVSERMTPSSNMSQLEQCFNIKRMALLLALDIFYSKCKDAQAARKLARAVSLTISWTYATFESESAHRVSIATATHTLSQTNDARALMYIHTQTDASHEDGMKMFSLCDFILATSHSLPSRQSRIVKLNLCKEMEELFALLLTTLSMADKLSNETNKSSSAFQFFTSSPSQPPLSSVFEVVADGIVNVLANETQSITHHSFLQVRERTSITLPLALLWLLESALSISPKFREHLRNHMLFSFLFSTPFHSNNSTVQRRVLRISVLELLLTSLYFYSNDVASSTAAAAQPLDIEMRLFFACIVATEGGDDLLKDASLALIDSFVYNRVYAANAIIRMLDSGQSIDELIGLRLSLAMSVCKPFAGLGTSRISIMFPFPQVLTLLIARQQSAFFYSHEAYATFLFMLEFLTSSSSAVRRSLLKDSSGVLFLHLLGFFSTETNQQLSALRVVVCCLANTCNSVTSPALLKENVKLSTSSCAPVCSESEEEMVGSKQVVLDRLLELLTNDCNEPDRLETMQCVIRILSKTTCLQDMMRRKKFAHALLVQILSEVNKCQQEENISWETRQWHASYRIQPVVSVVSTIFSMAALLSNNSKSRNEFKRANGFHTLTALIRRIEGTNSDSRITIALLHLMMGGKVHKHCVQLSGEDAVNDDPLLPQSFKAFAEANSLIQSPEVIPMLLDSERFTRCSSNEQRCLVHLFSLLLHHSSINIALAARAGMTDYLLSILQIVQISDGNIEYENELLSLIICVSSCGISALQFENLLSLTGLAPAIHSHQTCYLVRSRLAILLVEASEQMLRAKGPRSFFLLNGITGGLKLPKNNLFTRGHAWSITLHVRVDSLLQQEETKGVEVDHCFTVAPHSASIQVLLPQNVLTNTSTEAAARQFHCGIPRLALDYSCAAKQLAVRSPHKVASPVLLQMMNEKQLGLLLEIIDGKLCLKMSNVLQSRQYFANNILIRERQWLHVAITQSVSSELKVWVDGRCVLTISNALSLYSRASALTICYVGCAQVSRYELDSGVESTPTHTLRHLNGSVANICLFKDSLTAEDVQLLSKNDIAVLLQEKTDSITALLSKATCLFSATPANGRFNTNLALDITDNDESTMAQVLGDTFQFETYHLMDSLERHVDGLLALIRLLQPLEDVDDQVDSEKTVIDHVSSARLLASVLRCVVLILSEKPSQLLILQKSTALYSISHVLHHCLSVDVVHAVQSLVQVLAGNQMYLKIAFFSLLFTLKVWISATPPVQRAWLKVLAQTCLQHPFLIRDPASFAIILDELSAYCWFHKDEVFSKYSSSERPLLTNIRTLRSELFTIIANALSTTATESLQLESSNALIQVPLFTHPSGKAETYVSPSKFDHPWQLSDELVRSLLLSLQSTIDREQEYDLLKLCLQLMQRREHRPVITRVLSMMDQPAASLNSEFESRMSQRVHSMSDRCGIDIFLSALHTNITSCQCLALRCMFSLMQDFEFESLKHQEVAAAISFILLEEHHSVVLTRELHYALLSMLIGKDIQECMYPSPLLAMESDLVSLTSLQVQYMSITLALVALGRCPTVALASTVMQDFRFLLHPNVKKAIIEEWAWPSIFFALMCNGTTSNASSYAKDFLCSLLVFALDSDHGAKNWERCVAFLFMYASWSTLPSGSVHSLPHLASTSPKIHRTLPVIHVLSEVLTGLNNELTKESQLRVSHGTSLTLLRVQVAQVPEMAACFVLNAVYEYARRIPECIDVELNAVWIVLERIIELQHWLVATATFVSSESISQDIAQDSVDVELLFCQVQHTLECMCPNLLYQWSLPSLNLAFPNLHRLYPQWAQHVALGDKEEAMKAARIRGDRIFRSASYLSDLNLTFTSSLSQEGETSRKLYTTLRSSHREVEMQRRCHTSDPSRFNDRTVH